jgi:hypothetical protein
VSSEWEWPWRARVCAAAGIGEVALLPLDVLKIRAQTNPESLAGKGVIDLFRTEGFALYRGIGCTRACQMPALPIAPTIHSLIQSLLA